jgi:hypothetical protein
LQFLFPANALILGCLTLGGHSSPGVTAQRRGFASSFPNFSDVEGRYGEVGV